MIEEYMVCHSTLGIGALEKLVDKALAEGWILHGGLVVYDGTLMQAMIRGKLGSQG